MIDVAVLHSFRKEASAGLNLSLAAVAAGTGLTAYDLYKSRGLSKDQEEVMREISGQTSRKKVNLKSYLKDRDPKVKVLTTESDVDRFVKAEGMKGFRKTLVAASLKDAIANKNNAFAYRGPSGDYILGNKTVPKAIADHELGHIHDFREKGIVSDGSPRMGEYVTGSLDAFSQTALKSRFKSGRYRAETEAWKRAKISKEDKDLQELALRTYDKSFHASRAATVGIPTISLGALSALALATLK